MARNLRKSTVPDTAEELIDTRSLPDDEISSLEFQVTLSKALDRLNPRCRKLITEMYLLNPDKKYRDIASMIGVKPNSFGPLRKRCLIKLREILREMGYLTD